MRIFSQIKLLTAHIGHSVSILYVLITEQIFFSDTFCDMFYPFSRALLSYSVSGKKLAPSGDLQELGFLAHTLHQLASTDCAFTSVAEC